MTRGFAKTGGSGSEDTFLNGFESASSNHKYKAYIIAKTMRDYLAEYEDCLIALHRLNDKEDRLVPEKGLVKLGK